MSEPGGFGGSAGARLMLGVFVVHNVEEIIHLPRDLERLPDWVSQRGLRVSTPSFAVATGLLTVAVGAASLTGVGAGGLRRTVLVGGPAAALVGNAFSHVGRALVLRRYNGGLASAPVMALVAGYVFGASTRSASAPARRRTFLLGNVAALPAIIGALWGGRVLADLYTRSVVLQLPAPQMETAPAVP
ncbi:HXXEE domain-containing protein [Kocuria palustris]|uniref:HXXEE domain-containing protein n=1 Tax=Kocuria palustris TaxID=71999 RepID=UPI003D72B685